MPTTTETPGTIVACTNPTPGLKLNGIYEVVMVEEDIIMGPLLRVRDDITRRLLPDAYYPWRFTILGRR